HDVTDGVEARASGATGDLVELPGVQQPHPLAVELRQARQQHGADGHVDAHPERVGAADDLQQPGLGQLLDQDRKSTRLNSSHVSISYAVFCLKKKTLYNEAKTEALTKTKRVIAAGDKL